MLCSDLLPDRALVRHVSGEGQRHRRPDLQTEMPGGSEPVAITALRNRNCRPVHLDAWLVHYNRERPHLGDRNQGRRPWETVELFVSQSSARQGG